jgi:hypothetical protein
MGMEEVMAVPQGGDVPSRYQPNPVDDRVAVDAERGEAYRAIAAAIEEVEGLIDGGIALTDPKVAATLRSAESALRRAAFTLIVHA